MNARAFYLSRPIPYGVMSRVQDELLDARIRDEIPDTVFFLEHTPVVTLGRRGRDACLKLPPDQYEARRIDLHTSSRGGDATYHAPGQLVIYPIIRLGEKEADAHGYLFNLEEMAIRTAAAFDVAAFRREGKSGAWTSAGKIAAIGFRLKRWVTSHGMSFNVNLELGGFHTIIPCGLAGEPVASLRVLLADRCPAVSDVREIMCRHFSEICDRPVSVQSLDLSNEPDPDTLSHSLLSVLRT